MMLGRRPASWDDGAGTAPSPIPNPVRVRASEPGARPAEAGPAEAEAQCFQELPPIRGGRERARDGHREIRDQLAGVIVTDS